MVLIQFYVKNVNFVACWNKSLFTSCYSSLKNSKYSRTIHFRLLSFSQSVKQPRRCVTALTERYVFLLVVFRSSVKKVFRGECSRPPPSCLKPLFQSEAMKGSIWKWLFYSHAKISHFQQKGLHLALFWKRDIYFETRKWPVLFNVDQG